MKLVLDTNVIVSAFIKADSKPSQILKLILNGKAQIYINTAILWEYEMVMLRPKFAKFINPDNIRRFINLVRSIGISYDPPPGNKKLPDEGDRVFYETAKGSSSFLVTGNLKHFPKESFIVSPAVFLERMSTMLVRAGSL